MSPFTTGDLVYLSTKNLTLPKGQSRKLFPKFIGPFHITHDFGNSSYHLDLPPELQQHGIHGSFHTSLLCVHNPNDDHCFPGRQLEQLVAFHDAPQEWAVDWVVGHHGIGRSALFKLLWKSGDKSWVSYQDISHLEALGAYLELCRAEKIENLPPGTHTPPSDPELQASLIALPSSYVYKRQ